MDVVRGEAAVPRHSHNRVTANARHVTGVWQLRSRASQVGSIRDHMLGIASEGLRRHEDDWPKNAEAKEW
jgi:hypothetical protein